jgi:hypothetical protein
MSGGRIEIRTPEYHLVQSTRSKRTFRVPISPTRALKISSGDLVVRDSYLARKSVLAFNTASREETDLEVLSDDLVLTARGTM